MNICMCGYQPGDHAHRVFCPYPLFRCSERDALKWMDAENRKRDRLRDHARRQCGCLQGDECGDALSADDLAALGVTDEDRQRFPSVFVRRAAV